MIPENIYKIPPKYIKDDFIPIKQKKLGKKEQKSLGSYDNKVYLNELLESDVNEYFYYYIFRLTVEYLTLEQFSIIRRIYKKIDDSECRKRLLIILFNDKPENTYLFYKEMFEYETDLVLKCLCIRGCTSKTDTNEMVEMINSFENALLEFIAKSKSMNFRLWTDLESKMCLGYLMKKKKSKSKMFQQIKNIIQNQYDSLPEMMKGLYSIDYAGKHSYLIDYKKHVEAVYELIHYLRKLTFMSTDSPRVYLNKRILFEILCFNNFSYRSFEDNIYSWDELNCNYIFRFKELKINIYYMNLESLNVTIDYRGNVLNINQILDHIKGPKENMLEANSIDDLLVSLNNISEYVLRNYKEIAKHMGVDFKYLEKYDRMLSAYGARII